MKKVLFSIAIIVVAAMASCTGKASKGGGNASVALADSAVTEAPAEGAPAAGEWDVKVNIYDQVMYEAIIRDAKGNDIMLIGGNTVDYPEEMLKPFGNVWQADVNFDGHTDIMICLGMKPVNGQSVTWYEAWLYNPQTGKFYSHSDFRQINNPEVDTVNKYITGHNLLRDGKTKQYTAYAIQENGSLKKLKEWQKK